MARETDDVEDAVMNDVEWDSCFTVRHKYTLPKIQMAYIQWWITTVRNIFHSGVLLYLPSSRSGFGFCVRRLWTLKTLSFMFSFCGFGSGQKLSPHRRLNLYLNSSWTPLFSSIEYRRSTILVFRFAECWPWLCKEKFRNRFRRNVKKRYCRITFHWSSNEVKEKICIVDKP